MQGSQPKCPRCSGAELTLMRFKQTPSQPGRRPLYVYKCICGLYFTSDDPPAPSAPPSNG